MPRATRVELWLYAAPTGAVPALCTAITADARCIYAVTMPQEALKRLATLV